MIGLRLHRAAALAAALAALGAASTSLGADVRREAGRWVEIGNRHFAQQSYQEALEAYQRAAALYPSPRLAFNLGKAEQALGHPLAAAEHFARFLSGAGLAPTAAAMIEAKERLAALDGELGHLRFTGPASAAISLDGISLGVLPLPRLRVLPGDHRVEASLPGHEPRVSFVAAPPGLETEIRIQLEPTPPRPPPLVLAPPLPPPPTATVAALAPARPSVPAPPQEAEGGPPAWLIWAGILIVVAAGASAAALHFVRVDPERELGKSSTADWERL